ncbi:MAG TPA: 3,4-dehydroadipyl-CoA semialdehyde dehydrogenase [Planctomycetota bacterium]|nr:3,4-dehydroadipyl-CoA semialdehyde dehydrogenase [Planctomycetota bacterium]
MQTLESLVLGRAVRGSDAPVQLHNPSTEEALADVRSGGIDFRAVVEYARATGGPALRAMSFAQRGALLKALSGAIHAEREALIELSIQNAGTPRGDAKFDIDGATGTLAYYGALGETLGDRRVLFDGEGVQLGRTARFWGQHVLVPRLGAAVHINAFNFPAWNMMEKAACALLAGVPVIEKPGTSTAMLAARIARIVHDSGILPAGAWQFIAGSVGDLIAHLDAQDSIAFTGSSRTAALLRGHPNVVRNNVRINLEADSLNAAILAPDVDSSSETYALFLSNVALDITQKSGQKCTAVRRILVPRERVGDVRADLVAALAKVKLGDPTLTETRMGPLASKAQFDEVRAGIARLAGVAEVACGGAERARDRGYFVAPTLLVARDANADVFHADEVFGPAACVLAYSGAADEAAALVARGGGGLVASAYSNAGDWVERIVLGLAPWHGRLWLGSDRMAEQSLPPGMVLPASIHGGPGRAGGGEELGGLRGLAFYQQRTALQGFKSQITAFGPVESSAVS